MKLDLILENVRNKYNLGLLEESTLSELEVLKGRIMINESTMNIRKMLVEEGTIDTIKSFLEESWSYELYEEAQHSNHSWLDKSDPKNADGRTEFAHELKDERQQRDTLRKDKSKVDNQVHANTIDNITRLTSNGGLSANSGDTTIGYVPKLWGNMIKNKLQGRTAMDGPARSISSAKK